MKKLCWTLLLAGFVVQTVRLELAKNDRALEALMSGRPFPKVRLRGIQGGKHK